MNPNRITNPLQSDPHKTCETKPGCPGTDTKLFIRGDKIIRLCTGCVTSSDEPLHKTSRFERRRLLPDHNKRFKK